MNSRVHGFTNHNSSRKCGVRWRPAGVCVSPQDNQPREDQIKHGPKVGHSHRSHNRRCNTTVSIQRRIQRRIKRQKQRRRGRWRRRQRGVTPLPPSPSSRMRRGVNCRRSRGGRVAVAWRSRGVNQPAARGSNQTWTQTRGCRLGCRGCRHGRSDIWGLTIWPYDHIY